MPSYQFTIGRPTDVIYIDASVTAASPEDAVAKLKTVLPIDIDFTPDDYVAEGRYAQALINRDAIGVQHIVRIDEDPVAAHQAPV